LVPQLGEIVEQRSELGEDLQKAMAARGRELSLAEARRLALALLDLVRCDLLEPVTDDAPPGGPHVYNMGPFEYKKNQEEAPC
jgi:hypothetical protein